MIITQTEVALLEYWRNHKAYREILVYVLRLCI